MSEPRAPRKAVSLLLKLNHANIGEFSLKYATNISEGGLFIRSRDPKPVGTLLSFKVEIAGGVRVLQGTASVEWTRVEGDPAGPAGMGVKFVELDDASRALVDRIVGKGAPAPVAKPAPSASKPKPKPVAPPIAAPATSPAKPAPAAITFDEDEPLVPTSRDDGDLEVPLVDPAKEVDLDLDALLAGSPPPAPSTAPEDFVVGQLEEIAPPISAPPALSADAFNGFDLDLEPVVAAPAPAPVAKAAPAPVPAPAPAPAVPAKPATAPTSALPEIRRTAPLAAPQIQAPQQLKAAVPKPPAERAAAGQLVFLKPPETLDATGPIIGIDLGTTNSCVAVLANGKPRVLRSKDGYSTIPSVVGLNSKGTLTVGHRAKSQIVLSPQSTIYGAKRLVGRDFDSPTVTQVRERFRFNVVPGPDGKAAVALGPHTLALEEVQGIILREMKEFAEQYLEKKVSRAVVTCPAYYSEQQREAVRKAGALAGLKVERVLNEPTAAALAYGLNRELTRKVLVYDLGGGTFDATLLRIDKNAFEVLATGGDVFLGGIDFDNLVIDILLKKFQTTHGVEFGGDPVALSRVADQAERAKTSLTDMTTYEVHLPMLQMTADGKPLDLKCTLTRDELNRICEPLVARTIDVVNDVLLDAKLRTSEIDDVILVGGMTRMPAVRKRIETWFKKAPQASVNADEAVALGAALYSGTIDKLSSVTLIDVVPMTIGVGMGGGAFKRIIERNTPLPVSKTFTVGTRRDNEARIEINIFQGEDASITGNDYVGTVRVDGLPLAPMGKVQVMISLNLDAECVLHVEARELSTKRAFNTTLATRYTSEQIRAKLGVKDAGPSIAELKRAEELTARGGSFWGRLKRVFGGKT